MLIDEVIAFARDYVNNQTYRTAERKTKIREVLIQLTGEKINFGCSTCYIEALFKILNLTQMATPKGYELRKGYLAQFQDAYNGIKSFTNLQMTDDLAEEYLRRYPERAIYFARIPAPIPRPIPVISEIVEPEKIIIPEEKPLEVAQSLIETITKEPKKPIRKPTKAKK
jgi:hypothetical protein